MIRQIDVVINRRYAILDHASLDFCAEHDLKPGVRLEVLGFFQKTDGPDTIIVALVVMPDGMVDEVTPYWLRMEEDEC